MAAAETDFRVVVSPCRGDQRVSYSYTKQGKPPCIETCVWPTMHTDNPTADPREMHIIIGWQPPGMVRTDGGVPLVPSLASTSCTSTRIGSIPLHRRIGQHLSLYASWRRLVVRQRYLVHQSTLSVRHTHPCTHANLLCRPSKSLSHFFSILLHTHTLLAKT